MAVFIEAHIQVGQPTPASLCDRCHHTAYRFPLIALLPTGVADAGEVTACPQCDTAREVVREKLIRGWTTDA